MPCLLERQVLRGHIPQDGRIDSSRWGGLPCSLCLRKGNSNTANVHSCLGGTGNNESVYNFMSPDCELWSSRWTAWLILSKNRALLFSFVCHDVLSPSDTSDTIREDLESGCILQKWWPTRESYLLLHWERFRQKLFKTMLKQFNMQIIPLCCE